MKTDRKNGCRKTPKSGTESFRRFVALGAVLILFAGLAGAGFLSRNTSKPAAVFQKTSASKLPRTLEALVALKPDELEGTDIALMNLLCAHDLPGADKLNIDEYLATLSQWASRVESETARNSHLFRKDPGYYYHSEAFYKMLMMAVVVYEDFGVRYNPKWIAPPSEIRGDDLFFADSRDILIHGMLEPQRMGTCSSMPVLYIALGRRLGYPLKLVTAKQHLFMRWDSPTEKFNMEATGKGLDRYDDDHFKQWPFPITEQEIRDQDHLKSLSTREELSVFLSIRGACLTETGRLAEATASFNAAYLHAPNWKGNQVLLAQAQQRLRPTDMMLLQQERSRRNPNMPPDPNPLQKIQNTMRTP